MILNLPNSVMSEYIIEKLNSSSEVLQVEEHPDVEKSKIENSQLWEK